ncbi:MAG: protein DA1 [Candidatus Sericytochromatia bacterium]
MVTPPTVCSRCNKRLGPQVIRVAGKQFHPDCYLCDHCRKPLADKVIPRAARLYHPACHDALFLPRCQHCGEAIQGSYSKDAQGRYHTACYEHLHQLSCAFCSEALHGSYLYDGWGQKAHPEHGGVAVGQCHVCARLLDPRQSPRLSDGRLLCSGCQSSEIRDFQQIQRAKLAVIAQMQAVGFAYIPDYIKVELAEDQGLINQRLKASPTGNIHGYTRTAQRHIPGYGLILEHSITIMSGLPEVAFMGVLAHELLHVWIHEQGLKHLSHAEVEGFCNLGTALICHNAGSPLAQVLLQRMDADTDPAYGAGYRAMAWRLSQSDWPSLLQALHHPPLVAAPPEVLAPRTAPPLETAPAATPAALRARPEAAERLQALKDKLQQALPARETPSPSRPATESEAAERVRQRFAQKPKPAPGGSKLKKLRKPGS